MDTPKYGLKEEDFTVIQYGLKLERSEHFIERIK
jgi:hypothetical protein